MEDYLIGTVIIISVIGFAIVEFGEYLYKKNYGKIYCSREQMLKSQKEFFDKYHDKPITNFKRGFPKK